jgi:hypothetical protein
MMPKKQIEVFKNGEYVTTLYGCAEVAKLTGLHPVTVQKRCIDGRWTRDGYYFYSIPNSVAKYVVDGVAHSVTEICEMLDVSVDSFHRAIREGRTVQGKHISREGETV